MKLFSAFLISLLFLFLAAIRFPLYAFADYAKAYNDYTYNYTLYRQAYSDYQASKSTYATYRTLASQKDAVLKLRAVLTARNQLMFVYYDLLTEKLVATPEISTEYKGTFYNIKESEKKWLIENQTKVNAASTLGDLNGVAKEFENRYPQMDTETKFAITTILLSRDADAAITVEKLSQTLSEKLVEINAAGEDATWAQRGMANVQSKIELYKQKFEEAKKEEELLKTQQKLMEANQYLRDAINFMFEIVKGVTG